MNSFKLTRLGYQLPLTEENIEKCTKDLVLVPKVSSNASYQPKPIFNYRKSQKYIYVPRYYGIRTFGPPNEDLFQLERPKKAKVEFTGELRPYQEEIVEETIKQFRDSGINGGIWSIGTGLGKTCMALYLVAALKLKTVVIVNKNVLLQQWRDRINEFLPGARIGHIQQKIVDVHKKDIILGMLQSISFKNYSPTVFDDVGLLIIDEVHNVSSYTFSRLLFKIQTRYRLGLSATPIRADETHPIFIDHIGPIIINMSSTVTEPKIYTIHYDGTDIQQVYMRNGKLNTSKLITDIAESKERNRLIVKEALYRVHVENRKLIIFSDRLLQCKVLHHIINKTIRKHEMNYTCALFIGGLKEEEYRYAKTCDIIIATYGICKEGFDCPELDTMIIATPKAGRSIIQPLGRILRQENPNFALVIDIQDTMLSFCVCLYKQRKRYYKSKNYDFLNEEHGDFDDTIHYSTCAIKDDI